MLPPMMLPVALTKILALTLPVTSKPAAEILAFVTPFTLAVMAPLIEGISTLLAPLMISLTVLTSPVSWLPLPMK